MKKADSLLCFQLLLTTAAELKLAPPKQEKPLLIADLDESGVGQRMSVHG